MASKYAKPLSVPLEFPDILRNFTREVLRQQGKVVTADAIFEFGAQYFQDLIDARDGGNSQKAAATLAATPNFVKLAEEDIHSILYETFAENDTEQTGVLEYKDFKVVIEQVSNRIQLSPTDTKALYAEADESDNGTIVYGDYLPLAFQAILGLRARRNNPPPTIPYDESAVFLHGMSQEEIEGLLHEIFQRTDQSGTGLLNRLQFADAIKDADLGFTRREINILLSEAPVDEATGEIVYNDFIPVAFPVLKDSFVHHLIDIPSDEDSLKQYLVDVFGSADTESTGFVSVSELAKLFRAADIGLTRLQIVTVIAEAQEDDNGYVNYEKFAGHVASMVLLLISFEIQQSFSSFLRNYRKSADYYTVLEQNQHSFEQTLTNALEAADVNRRSFISRQDASDALQGAFPEISPRQIRTLLALADSDEMGNLEYHLIAHSAFQALQKLQEYDVMIAESNF